MIPNGTRFIGIATSVDLKERRSAILNKTTDPYTIEDIAEYIGRGDSIDVVINYSSLPSPSTVIDKFYWCEESQGNKYLPGSLGGDYYPLGMYYSNGIAWSFLDVPYQATQSEVDNGINSNKFVTSVTLKNSTKWSTKQDTIVSDLGSILFSNGTMITQDNDNLYWDITNKRLGLGTTEPTTKLHVYSETANTSGLRLERLTSASPTSTGQAIGVDASGNVVTVSGGYYNSINASEEVDTTSLTDVVVAGMTITPPAGTYKVDFNGNYDVIPGNVCTIASLDLQNMYLTLLNTPATGTHGLTFGSGETITPGVYTVAGAASIAGILTLDGVGDPNSLFIFRVTGAINTAIATTIQLSNGANAANVFFMAIGAVGIGADNVVSGNFIAYGAAAALGANCIFNGRMFSTSGALAFSSGIQSKPTATSVINMGILENFLCFTNQGNVANTALAVITGDLGTNFGNVTVFATSVFNGNAYDDTQQLGSTNMFSIYNGVTMVQNSSRLRRYYNYTEDVALTCVTTVDGTQAISVNWRTDVGRCILNNRILTIVKL